MLSLFFFGCVVLGGAVTLLMFVLGLFGGHDASNIGDSHEIGHTGDVNHVTAFFSVRSIAAGIAVFGICGKAAEAAGLSDGISLAIATGAGAIAMVLVGLMLQSMKKLQADGTIRLETAVGMIGQVYLTIPAADQGQGKITLTLQGRSIEVLAITRHPQALPTGSIVRVCALAAPQVFLVEPQLETKV